MSSTASNTLRRTDRIAAAVTALLVHGDEIFMVRRTPTLLAFPGYDAFPGGKVEDEDRLGAGLPLSLPGIDHATYLRALTRELVEELGFDLATAALGDEVLGITHIGSFITPPVVPKRYDTRFYRIILARRPEFRLDPYEAGSGEWLTPKVALERYFGGESLLAPPTLTCLQALAVDLNCPKIDESLIARPLDPRGHGVEHLYGMRQIYVASRTLPPAEYTNCFVIGDPNCPRIAVDPSPKNQEEFERIETLLNELKIDQIFLTHHHPDHHEQADLLARRNGWPLSMSRDTAERIRATEGAGFFKDVTVHLREEGDTVTHWLGHPVRVIAVPGHDEGQLALMPDNAAWCLVGDLIQGVGTVVISAPEGNMGRYFKSLERVIALGPRVIYPSHGIPMGTTYRLEETLRHRRQREEQVLQLHREGRSIDEILKSLYTDTDPRLLPHARRNIESHLTKLGEEGRLAV